MSEKITKSRWKEFPEKYPNDNEQILFKSEHNYYVGVFSDGQFYDESSTGSFKHSVKKWIYISELEKILNET